MEKNKNKKQSRKNIRKAIKAAKAIKLKEEYITILLKQLNQPYMVFDNKIFIIPTTSPMFELLPGKVSFNSPDKYERYEDIPVYMTSYAFVIVDLDTYKIDPVKDTFEYINEQKELI
tara:strand:+ start:63 stop:413 length:351 start_codon:yes stop_codon:yes gene_type:complete